jgi:hypothetical protein
MKDKVESSIHIDYHWNTDSGIDIPEAHKEALEEDAEERIFQMLKEGYNQGELCTTVRFGKDVVPEEDEEDGLEYSGWWGVKKESKP